MIRRRSKVVVVVVVVTMAIAMAMVAKRIAYRCIANWAQ